MSIENTWDSMMAHQVKYTLYLLLVFVDFSVLAQDDLNHNRIHTYYASDESSCICGVNRQVLDKLESILSSANLVSCPLTEAGLGTNDVNKFDSRQPQASGDDVRVPSGQHTGDSKAESNAVSTPSSLTAIQIVTGDLSNGKQEEQGNSQEIESNKIDSVSMIHKLTDEIHILESQLLGSRPATSSSISSTSIQSSSSSSSSSLSLSNGISSTSHLINTGFLEGIHLNPSSSHNEALMKLNQSHRIDAEEMTSALQSTIPNVVSNIFSNINNLTIETSQHQNSFDDQKSENNSSLLVSIDGNSVDVKGDSIEQLMLEGEKLFMNWIEHELASLHLTASTANYIRKNALNLFQRIVRQYVVRVQRLGGSIDDNVRRATQMALNNTQNLISFLLKNYLYFAGGLMRMIGEQVSRVGKQLDYTGDKMAHISLNPFDIVSNVIESLPNPSTYSEYFRTFGKQLIGETGQQSEKDTNGSDSDKPQGMITKTMGAISKTLGSWIG